MNWVKDKRQVDTGTGILMSACYNQKCGLSSLHIRNYCEILAPIGDLNIISPEQALNAYVDNYEQSEHSTSTTITGIELNYLVFVDGESLTALPCWMIHTKRIISEDYINPSTNAPFYEYPLYAVSADTGILLTDNEAKNS